MKSSVHISPLSYKATYHRGSVHQTGSSMGEDLYFIKNKTPPHTPLKLNEEMCCCVKWFGVVTWLSRGQFKLGGRKSFLSLAPHNFQKWYEWQETLELTCSVSTLQSEVSAAIQFNSFI